jgi:hypothetical protein
MNIGRATEARRALFVSVLRVAFALAGLGTVAYLVRQIGLEKLGPLLAGSAPFLPLVLLLELGRQACDAAGTYFAYGEARRRVPFHLVFRGQLVGFALGHMLPAGKVASESSKAAYVLPFIGAETATAAALTNQALTFLSASLVSLFSMAAAWARLGFSALTAALLAHALILAILGLSMRAVMWSPSVARFFAKRFHRWVESVRSVEAAARVGGPVPLAPLAALGAGRLCLFAEIAVLALAAGVDLDAADAFIAGGLELLALAGGFFVPGQLGVSEGSLVIGASAFGAAAGQALSIGLLLHAVQIFLVPVGATLPLLVRPPKPSDG